MAKNKVDWVATEVPVALENDAVLTDWLDAQAEQHALRWLLVHADDGVIWGEWREGQLHHSHTPFPQVSPPLRTQTLQQARLFGSDAEVLLWQQEDGWRARLLADAGEADTIDERHLLWGTAVVAQKDGFVLLRDGEEGMRHAPPIPEGVTEPYKRHDELSLQVGVRHYIDYDADGQAFVACSRLYALDRRHEKRQASSAATTASDAGGN